MKNSPFSNSYFVAAANFFIETRNLLGSPPATYYPADDRQLITHVARFGAAPGHAKRLVMHFSGMHGAEGPVGSAMQLDAMRRKLFDIEALKKSETALVFAHAMNPYGFAHSRRGDENRVDANRNFLLPGETHPQDHPLNAQITGALVPNGRWSQVKVIPNVVGLYLSHLNYKNIRSPHDLATEFLKTRSNFSDALSAGTNNTNGMFYRGNGLCSTNRTLKEIINHHAARPEVEEVRVIDVHSGLGKFGEASLIIAPEPPDSLDMAQKLFDPKKIKNYDDIGVAEGTTGYNARAFNFLAAQGKKVGVFALEIGTYKKEIVGFTLARAAHLDRQSNPSQKDIDCVAKAMNEAFNPDNEEWRAQALAHGKETLQTALRF